MASLDTARPLSARRPAALPRPYLVWLVGTRASLLGDAVLYFALGWAASAHGGATGALVLTAITLPRTLLLLLGGAVADRFGARRITITGDAVMLTATLVLALASWRLGASVWLLVAVAAVIGTVDAFYLPATGSMPRRLVGKEQLPRALAVQQAGGQIASLLGAPLGAVLVAAAGLTGAAFADAATFAIVLVVLVCVRPAHDAERSPRTEGLLSGAADGVRIAVADPVLRPALLLTAAAACFLLPVVSLLNPLVAREHGWSAGVAGLVAGGQSLGVIAVALVVARRGTLRRIGVGAASGLCGAALGIAAVAMAGTPAVAVAGGVVAGAGSGMFACHIGPLVLTHAPGTHLARLQALLVLVQSLALVVGNNALGALADAHGATTAAAVCATGACTAGITALTLKPLRRLRRE
ncbi:MFS transporter [Streptomyces sp. NBC_01294]|uniref:MFS transporter n=1 Tax=Streptomyces sp. NBC_01294 TaxID=2903815 RepID=UPI002DD8C58C|nr:MFS transporter [Streptomyces sp. NBC_01294]WRZ58602.1 MFS transporter [Streptomyces sp. NBC_01294]